MNWLRMKYWQWMARKGYRPALMSLDMQGRLTTRHIRLHVLLAHYADEIAAARELARRLK